MKIASPALWRPLAPTLNVATGLVVALLISVLSAAPAASFAQVGRAAEPTYVLKRGDTGKQVRDLQARLHQLGLVPERTTGKYDQATAAAVSTFQKRQEMGTTGGNLNVKTWELLQSKTRQPTNDEIWNHFTPGPALYHAGDQGVAVRRMQSRLKQLRWYVGDISGRFDRATVKSVKGFQEKRRIPVTGEIDKRTKELLVSMTREPTRNELFNINPLPKGYDPRCATGRVLCISKTTRKLSWIVDGKILKTVDVRFGSDELPTRDGEFTVFRKSRDHVSDLYDTSMPFAMFFSGGQAVHYSPDFAATGYNGASHGCVNVRDYAAIQWLFDTQVRIGDRVIIYGG